LSLSSFTLVVLTALCIAVFLIAADRDGKLALDLKLAAAQNLLDGRTLYPEHVYPLGYPYPPLLAMLLVPLLALPTHVAAYIGALLCLAAVLGALRLVGVRDIRCLAIAALSLPVVLGAQLGNASAFICLLAALAWRFGPIPAGAAIALKLYAWPLAFWLAVTRGLRAGMLTVAAAGAFALLPWALLRFDGVTRYTSLAHEATRGTRGQTYAIALSGLPYAGAIAAAVTAAALAACWWRRADPAGSFALAVLASLTASPVVWGFYFALGYVALAVRRPTLTLAWFVPLLLWVASGTPTSAFKLWWWWLVMGGLLVWCGIGAPTRNSAGIKSLRHASRRALGRALSFSGTPRP
jgi:hypothetical protein